MRELSEKARKTLKAAMVKLVEQGLWCFVVSHTSDGGALVELYDHEDDLHVSFVCDRSGNFSKKESADTGLDSMVGSIWDIAEIAAQAEEESAS